MEVEIDLFVDGCRIITNEKDFSWGYCDEQLGTDQIKELLESLGHSVKLEEIF
jgi:hypothetical protein